MGIGLFLRNDVSSQKPTSVDMPIANEKNNSELSYDDLDGLDDEADQVNLDDEMLSLPDNAKRCT